MTAGKGARARGAAAQGSTRLARLRSALLGSAARLLASAPPSRGPGRRLPVHCLIAAGLTALAMPAAAQNVGNGTYLRGETTEATGTGATGSAATGGFLCINARAATGGGKGPSAAAITVDATATSLVTRNGLVRAVSVKGGKGGEGGLNNTSFPCNALGGTGGTGGDGGRVIVTVGGISGSLTTSASAIVATSTGGGGGLGGRNENSGGAGGIGGTGGAGGEIAVTNGQALVTTGLDAFAIFAQSRGGRGGDGGPSNGLFATDGGNAGSAGAGGAITITNTADLSTRASGAIFAESVGGTGGGGGLGSGVFGTSEGGFGGTGGAGGAVKVTSTGSTIFTLGLGSEAIFTHSVGGGGGAAGYASGTQALGATGGTAGPAGAVTVTNSATIATSGASSAGLFAQSVGGGGGVGGLAFADGARAVAVGGQGGQGGSGGAVVVANTGRIQTGGARNGSFAPQGSIGLGFGIFAQSVGGGGGAGGFGGAVSVAGSALIVGGQGGGGGNGGGVSVTSTAGIDTTEQNAAGIFAQSVGGGGGQAGGALSLGAGVASNTVSLGGKGGSGGTGGTVAVNCIEGKLLTRLSGACLTAGRLSGVQSGAITTNGAFSQAIFAQSVGGGGGSGGFAETLSVNLITVSDNRGGTGGAGGSGGVVYAGSAGMALNTSGNDSAALFAQSVGGGGGNGGSTVSSAFAVKSFDQSFGGTGGVGGAGGTVLVDNPGGRITTRGDASAGIFAQSVGGGGGNGGLTLSSGAAINKVGVTLGGSGGSGVNGGAVVVSNTGAIATGADGNGRASAAIFAQSIGGGGGNGGGVIEGGSPIDGRNGSVAFNSLFGGAGGGGGGGADAGTVAVNCFVGPVNGAGGSTACTVPFGGSQAATGLSSGVLLSTNGQYSPGIFAQSVGGGGGNGGYVESLSASVGISASTIFGGSGGEGGDGGAVYLSTAGMNVTTGGGDSAALVAQSVGGGGGDGGLTLSSKASLALTLTSALGGRGGGGRSGGDVLVDNPGGVLQTSGTDSAGIVAQSIGGGGGNGGNAVTAGAGGSISATTAIGGNGGAGAEGRKVTVVNVAQNTGANNARIETRGAESPAILAQSIGGGGGNGGDTIAISGGSAALATAFGGVGAAGGKSGTVSVISTGAPLVTRGADSQAVIAQSIAGGGGTGGGAITGTISGGASMSQSFGGKGGAGGTASSVDVTLNGGALSTQGERSTAILAQSIGGAGGAGGSTAAVGASATGISLALAMGGEGGVGGTAGTVTVRNKAAGGVTPASITVSGFQAAGMIAQSIGGAGGTGGFAVSGSASLIGGIGSAVGIGGGGGRGGVAGQVTIDNDGAVNSAATGGGTALLLAQSIGGAGGSGGFSVAGALSMGAAGALSVGGGGGNGGTAGTVDVNNFGLLKSSNGNTSAAGGILAQSIGGAGGNGGFSVAGAIGGQHSIGISIGGGGGTGGVARTVTVNNSGQIESAGDVSHAITAQSIGGNGGNGGFSVAGAVGAGPTGAASVGGGGGTGGTAGDVKVGQRFANNQLFTSGDGSTGILAQSIGGAGGSSGFTVSGSAGSIAAASVAVGQAGGGGGRSGTVTVDLTGNGSIRTVGASATGIRAASIGGTGGDASFTMSLAGSTTASSGTAVGGGGGSGGQAGRVAVTTVRGANITTGGALAIGIDASSIGGNGGTGGDATAAAAAVGNPKVSVAVGTAKGGKGGSGNTGGTVDVTLGGDITTGGVAAMGLRAQSIGGDGGNGGSAIAYSASASGKSDGTSVAVSVAVGGEGAAGGNAGSVNVVQNGTISTGSSGNRSAQAVGLFAQSVGGGGGTGGSATSKAFAGGESVSIGVGGGGDVGGHGGAVTVTSNAGVTTWGDQAVAIKAQSVGGGGGSGGAADVESSSNKYAAAVGVGGFGGGGGNGAAVNVTTNNSVQTNGALSHGIFAQSVGGGGGDGGASSATAKPSDLPTVDNFDDLRSGVASATGSGKASAGSSVYSARPGTKGPATSAAGNAPDGGFDGGLAGAFSMGGSGANGGIGGTVDVRVNGSVGTTGALAHGVFAQSVGGGGGSAGQTTSEAEGEKFAGSFSLGGNGGGGQSGGTVSVNTAGTAAISVTGAQSSAIFAQSVGGGGGNAGTVENTAQAGKIAALSVGLGGSGGTAGNGGAVNVNSNGALSANSVAVFAQSVGGGGGHAADTSNSAKSPDVAPKDIAESVLAEAGRVDLPNTLDGARLNRALASNSKLSTGVANAARSGFSLGMTLGGTAGSGGNGGAVNVASGGSITTGTSAQAGSAAIFAQSVGGGGGDAAQAAAESNVLTGSIGMAYGASSGDGGNGGTVTVRNTAALTTSAAQSSGIFVQSVGGGGGAGVSAQRASAIGGNFAISNAMGASGGKGGAGADLSITSSGGRIATAGDLSYGIYAQSVGGGGGTAGSVMLAATAGQVAGEARASASVTTQSASAAAGVAVAAGLGTRAGGGNGANVTLNSTGRLETTGRGAAGIVAQSIGGGGGTSAVVTTNAASGSAAVAFSAGTVGGDGGKGGRVDVDAGNILTTGALAYGLVAQSVGGGGGIASAIETTTARGGTADLKLRLGDGTARDNDAGRVDVTLLDRVETRGAGAAAVIAQSIASGGGIQGASLQSGGNSAVNAEIQMMAWKGNGSGGEVTLTGASGASTTGENAPVLLAQSVGGGGGFAQLIDRTSGLTAIKARTILGGYGTYGASGDGFSRAVTINYGTSAAVTAITTAGDQSAAIIAQSIAGSGGVALQRIVNGGSTSPGAALVAELGGGWGRVDPLGGHSQAVTQTLTRLRVETAGSNAPGLVAQSVAGGGGLVGTAVSMGGGGPLTSWVRLGTEGRQNAIMNSGAVTASLANSSVTTTGFNAPAMVAQSVGGGGGLYLGRTDGSLGSAAAPDWRVGGNANNGIGAAVTLTSTGNTIRTTSALSFGIIAQSIGGGGGTALWTHQGNGGTMAGSVRLGAQDHVVDVDAGTVNSTLTDTTISTAGAFATGVVVQSIGRGGGIAGISTTAGIVDQARLGSDRTTTPGSGGSGFGVTVAATSSSIALSGASSFGMVVQSIGGGGGLMATPVEEAILGINGKTGISSFGGAVNIQSTPTITVTNGALKQMVGIVAQSIGGGGGLALIAGKATLGGTVSDSGSTGGTVNIRVTNPITMASANSIGVVAQSIGGGGGLVIGTGTATVVAGKGSGNNVTVTIDAPITMTGANSVGVLAQSTGNGGGAVLTGGRPILLAGGNAGGTVTVKVNKSVVATGAGSVAILIKDKVSERTQSALGPLVASAPSEGELPTRGYLVADNRTAAGAEGTTDMSPATPKPVTPAITEPPISAQQSSGEPNADGEESDDPLRPVIGGEYEEIGERVVIPVEDGPQRQEIVRDLGPTVVEILSGITVVGGAGTAGAAVEFEGDGMLIVERGAVIASQDVRNGVAVHSRSGSITIDNMGEIRGDFDLAFSPTSVLNNRAGGIFYAGRSERLGGGTLVNDGMLLLEEEGITAATLDAALRQGATGTTLLRVNQPLGQADRFAVTGPVAMSGKLMLSLMDLELTKPGVVDFGNVFATGSGASLSGLAITAPQIGDSLIQRFTATAGAGGVALRADTDFAPIVLPDRAQQVGIAVGAVQAGGSSTLFRQVTLSVLPVAEADELTRRYDALGSNAASAAPQASMTAAAAALDTVGSRLDAWRTGDAAGMTAGRSQLAAGTLGGDGNGHVWGSLDTSRQEDDVSTGHQFGGTVGVDYQLPGRALLVGAAVSYAEGSYRIGAPSARVENAQFGLTLYGIGRVGAAHVAASVLLGGGRNDLSRNLAALGLPYASTVRLTNGLVGGRLEIGHRIGGEALALTPFAAIAPVAVFQRDAAERFGGSGLAGIDYRRSTVTTVPTYLGAHLNGRLGVAGGSLEPLASVAWMHDLSPNRGVFRNFAEQPLVVFSGNALPVVRDAAALKLGAQFRSGAFGLQLLGEAQLSDARQSYGGQLRLSIRW